MLLSKQRPWPSFSRKRDTLLLNGSSMCSTERSSGSQPSSCQVVFHVTCFTVAITPSSTDGSNKASDHRMGFGDRCDFTSSSRAFIPENFPSDLSAISKHLLCRKIQIFILHGTFLRVSLAER